MTEKPKTTTQAITDTDIYNLSQRSVDKYSHAADRRDIIASDTPKSEGNKPSEKKGNGQK